MVAVSLHILSTQHNLLFCRYRSTNSSRISFRGKTWSPLSNRIEKRDRPIKI